MKIGVVGIGVVGGAVLTSFQLKMENEHTIVGYDKYRSFDPISEIFDTDVVFLCLPTPYDKSLETYDISSTHEILGVLSEHRYQGIVVIKSTVVPTTCQKLSDQYGLAIIHNPEFLTAKTAFDDFHNQNHIVIGPTSNSPRKSVDTLVELFSRYYPEATISICDNAEESESMKIFCNSFYAAKIQFFNELYLLCRKLGIDFNNVRSMMLKNNWINPMHTLVPGSDGQLSYGGACFPKDTSALLSFMKEEDVDHAVLGAVVSERNIMRKD